MLQANQMMYQILANRANSGDPFARLELTFMAMQYLEKAEVPENIAFGMSVLEDLSKCRDEIFQSVLAKTMYEFALKILENNPTLAVQLFILASELGNLEAKRNLAVCFFEGDGTTRQLDKVVDLLKECYHAGDQTVLAKMYTIAVQLLSGYNGRVPSALPRAIEISTAVELLKFAARAGHASALKDFAILGWWFYRGIAPCSRDVEQGVAIVKMAAKLGDKWAVKQINTIAVSLLSGSDGCQKDVEYSMELFAYAAQGDEDARFNLHVLANLFLSPEKLEPDYGIDEQDVPTGRRILDYLSVLNTLDSHLPRAPIRAIICEYLPEI
ncbi:MAG TPA: tetratricopeptide repeat protein, partial [Gammaproteobacteria bacterium]|nr:tetratricopeptide repeat protein [Gammaproteobacteria bacterium]